MSLSKDITNFFDKLLKKRDLSDQSKEGNSQNEPKKIREEISSIEILSEMSDASWQNQLRNNRLKAKDSWMTYMTLYNLFQTNSSNMKKIKQKGINQ